MREETLGLVKALCPSVGECQGREEGVGGWMGGCRKEKMVYMWIDQWVGR